MKFSVRDASIFVRVIHLITESDAGRGEREHHPANSSSAIEECAVERARLSLHDADEQQFY